MPKFLQSSAPKGGARVRNKADSIFGYVLSEHDCMNYLSVCLHELQSVAILTLNGDVPILMFPVLFMGNERRVLVAFPSCGQPILATHIYTLSYRLQHLARAQFFLLRFLPAHGRAVS